MKWHVLKQSPIYEARLEIKSFLFERNIFGAKGMQRQNNSRPVSRLPNYKVFSLCVQTKSIVYGDISLGSRLGSLFWQKKAMLARLQSKSCFH